MCKKNVSQLLLFVVIASVSSAAPFTDGVNTKALWHCDSVDMSWGYGRALDDDSANPGRDNDWELKPWAGPIATVEPGMPGYGNALRFSGENGQIARANRADDYGMDAGNFQIDLFLKLDSEKKNDGTRYDIFEQESRMNFRVLDSVNGNGDPVYYFMWNTWGHKTNGQPAVTSVYGALYTDMTDWHHLTVQFIAGQQNILIDGVLAGSEQASYAQVDAPSTEYGRIFFAGNRSESVYMFKGVLDEVMISSPIPEPATLLLSLFGLAFIKKNRK
jgi:hypothetical protein